jgi:predicted GNAT family acetyltransferase
VPDVIDDPATGRLVLPVDGREASLFYRVVGRRLVILHTEVPEALGGQGLGGFLVRAALARAGRDGLTVVPLCPFARTWLTDHPDALDGVGVDWEGGG